jgi:hypothetical protein
MALTKTHNRMIAGSIVNAVDFGASPSAAASANVSAIQAAVNTGSLVFLPKGVYQTDAPIVFDRNASGLIGENYGYSGPKSSVIDYTGSDCAIKIEDSTTSVAAALSFERFGIGVRSANAKGIDFSNASYCSFSNIWIRLYADDQSGVYGKGNGLGSAPYYNKFDNVQMFGQVGVGGVTGQKGYFFEGNTVGGFLANGPNANVVSNIGRISGVDVAFDIQSGNGNLLSNISCESVKSFVFRIGLAGSGAPGRADGNTITNVRVEGSSSCIFAKFEGDANGNSISQYALTSLNSVLFQNNAEYRNFCKPTGVFYVANFYAKNIASGATTLLDPEFLSVEGGIRVPINAIPYAMYVTVNRFASGGLGSGVVNFYRSGTIHPILNFTVDNSTRFGGRTLQTAPDRGQSYNAFDTVNGSAQVNITTDGTWNQTAADVQVQMVFLG